MAAVMILKSSIWPTHDWIFLQTCKKKGYESSLNPQGWTTWLKMKHQCKYLLLSFFYFRRRGQFVNFLWLFVVCSY